MIQISDHPEGCLLSVRAQPGAKRNAVLGEHAGSLKVAVTAPADKGRANEAIIEVLAEHLGVKRSHIELVSGPTSRDKKFLIRGVDREALADRLRRLDG